MRLSTAAFTFSRCFYQCDQGNKMEPYGSVLNTHRNFVFGERGPIVQCIETTARCGLASTTILCVRVFHHRSLLCTWNGWMNGLWSLLAIRNISIHSVVATRPTSLLVDNVLQSHLPSDHARHERLTHGCNTTISSKLKLADAIRVGARL